MYTPEQLEDWRQRALRVEAEVAKAIVGQHATVRLVNVALFARGHVLLEGDVGVGKTTLLRAFARAAGGDFERVEGTVDLMPGDLIYHTYVDAEMILDCREFSPAQITAMIADDTIRDANTLSMWARLIAKGIIQSPAR